MAMMKTLDARPAETTIRDYLADHGIVSAEVDRVDEGEKFVVVFRADLTSFQSDMNGAVEV